MHRQLVLLHGLARTRASLWPVARAARRRGYEVASIGYASRTAPIATLAERVAERMLARFPSGAIDAVTHSMGGIVLRVAVDRGWLPPERVGRVVMLAPPNGGSELADVLRDRWLYRRVLGPAGQELGVGDDSTPLALPPIPFACGVIAGRRTFWPLAARLFGGPSDGRVSVVRTNAPGVAARLVVDRAHPFLMWAPEVLAATFRFLDAGTFGDRSVDA